MRTTLSRKLLFSTGSIIVVLLSVAFLILERSQAQAWADYLYTQSLAFSRLATPELLKRFREPFPRKRPKTSRPWPKRWR